MKTIAQFIAPPRPCSYLRDQRARMEYLVALELSPEEYLERLRTGWRRFGRTLFRPRCRSCAECRSLRVDVARFRPDRSMNRVRRKNAEDVSLQIAPALGLPDPEVLELYGRYHRDQFRRLGWPPHKSDTPEDFHESFLDNPVPTQEWQYRLDGRLVGVGYVDDLPGASSAIYFVHDPVYRDRSLGTWNILCMIDRASAERRQHVYLGYYVADCRSLSYKERFVPSEILRADGTWMPFRS